VLGVDSYAFLSIVSVAALAALVTAVAARRGFVIPVVALEVVLGVIIGPHVLDWAHVDDFTDFFAALGLGMLFFFAGYEVDFGRIQGRPVRLGGLGWLMSLALAFSIGGVLHVLGIVRSDLYAGSALTTTAIGTLIPILSDAKELQTRFGTYLLAAGAFAEFGPILLVTLVLSATSPLHNALLLIAFVTLAVLVAILSVRTFHHTWSLWVLTLESSGQLAVRMVVVLVFLLGLAASELGLDLLLGGFAAGMIVRLLLRGREGAARPGAPRRTRLPDRHRRVLALGSGCHRTEFGVHRRGVRAGRHRHLRSADGGCHAGGVRRHGAAGVRSHPDRRHPSLPDASVAGGAGRRASSARRLA
jgi:Kef-type K+ transport system membrane component KefB